MADWGGTSRQTARRIMRDVDDRDLGPGSSIGSEASMLSRFEVSRATLREATRLLRFLGATATRAGPGGGLVARRADATVLASSMAMVLQHRQATFQSIADSLGGLAPVGAAMAARQRHEADVVALREAADGLSAASGEDARQGLLRFDHTLSAATHDAVFNLVWTAVLQISGVAPMPIPREISRRFAPAHHEIVDAVERRDDAGARRLMSASRRDLAAWMRAELSETLDRRVKWAEVDERLDVPTDFG